MLELRLYDVTVYILKKKKILLGILIIITNTQRYNELT